MSCDGCKKEFCSKYTLQRHYDVCIEYKSVKTKSEEVEKMKELIISLRTEVAIYKSKCEDLKQQNTELLKIINKQNI